MTNGIDDLETSVKSALEYYSAGFETSFNRYLSESVIPDLKTTLNDCRIQVEKHHRVGESITASKVVVHYTSLANTLSILQDASYRQDRPPNAQQENPGQGQECWWRLYDSAHFNDPDEGNYLILSPAQSHDLCQRPFRFQLRSSISACFSFRERRGCCL